MVKLFSWILVICIVLYFVGTIFLAFLGIDILPVFIGIVLIIAGISALGLICVLIYERIKDKEEEKDDLSKY